MARVRSNICVAIAIDYLLAIWAFPKGVLPTKIPFVTTSALGSIAGYPLGQLPVFGSGMAVSRMMMVLNTIMTRFHCGFEAFGATRWGLATHSLRSDWR